MEAFDAYSHALASLGGFAILMIVLGAMSTVGRTADNRCDCGQVKRKYSDPAYRRGRAFANAMEMVGPFLCATLAAILVGASPFWVNVLASVFFLTRVLMAIVHIGTEIQPLRSLFWAIGMFSVLALAIMAVWGAIT